MNQLVHNGVEVVFTLSVVTEPGEGWRGSRYIGSYDNLTNLNNAINSTEVPLYWELQVDLNDKHVPDFEGE